MHGADTHLYSPDQRFFCQAYTAERFFGDMVGKAMEAAAKCTECGECETRCPYQLPIRKLLQDQVEWYEALKKSTMPRLR